MSPKTSWQTCGHVFVRIHGKKQLENEETAPTGHEGEDVQHVHAVIVALETGHARWQAEAHQQRWPWLAREWR